jgi:hypothetical protein
LLQTPVQGVSPGIQPTCSAIKDKKVQKWGLRRLPVLFGCRFQLPSTPQHCAALETLLHRFADSNTQGFGAPPAAALDTAHQKQQQQQQQQQLEEVAAAWREFGQRHAQGLAAACSSKSADGVAATAGAVSTMHAGCLTEHVGAVSAVDPAEQAVLLVQEDMADQQQQQHSAAAGLLAYMQDLLHSHASNSDSSNVSDAGAAGTQGKIAALVSQQQVQLPGHVAAALAADITNSSSSGGGSGAAGPLTQLRSCLASMGAAALQQLQERGHR